MHRILLVLLLGAPACAGPGSADTPDAGALAGPRTPGAPLRHAPPYARLLGAAQDGGIPHLGCQGPYCLAARDEPHPLHRVTALAIVSRSGSWWLLDATPDLPAQIAAMTGPLEGIFLTHAHIGHYTGLMYLGREALHAEALPVHASRRMASFLETNGPWSQLVRLGEIHLMPFRPGAAVRLDEEIVVTPLQVPHRDEYADTHAFLIEVDGGASLLYLPDIDRWEDWGHDLAELAARVDVLVLDGSFYDIYAELSGRLPAEVPHPQVPDTVRLLSDAVQEHGTTVIFTHLNHTNPLWDSQSAESRELRARGFGSALDHQVFPLGPLRRGR